jgi:hypothetical protein
MTPVAMSNADTLHLPAVAEAASIKEAARAGVEQCPDRWPLLLGQPGGITDELWHRWGPQIEPAGIDRRSFDAIVADYQRELWHWLWGDRTWAQCAEGLAGRLTRRIEKQRPTPP